MPGFRLFYNPKNNLIFTNVDCLPWTEFYCLVRTPARDKLCVPKDTVPVATCGAKAPPLCWIYNISNPHEPTRAVQERTAFCLVRIENVGPPFPYLRLL